MKSFVLYLGSQGCAFSDSETLSKNLHRCLDELEPIQKLVLQLRFWEEMTIQQIAIVTKRSWDDIDHLLEKTFAELRQMLTNRLTQKSA